MGSLTAAWVKLDRIFIMNIQISAVGEANLSKHDATFSGQNL
jgi:hypothetical protein